MQLQTTTKDPLGVLATTKQAVENSHFVTLDTDSHPKVCETITSFLKAKGLPSTSQSFRTTGKLEDDLQLIFLEDALNFCFWARQDDTRWQIEWPEGYFVKGGWYMLTASLRRAIEEGKPLLDPEFLTDITLEDVRDIFRSANDLEIPLIQERMTTLHEIGRGLTAKFKGHIKNLLTESGYDAIQLTKLIAANFPSFRDIEILETQQVKFFARAQICANDISLVLQEQGLETLKNLDQLTAFANYKLPQILRMFGVLKYSEELEDKVDGYIELSPGSREEIEIRAATIWAMELIRQQVPEYTVAQLDNALWLIAQELQTKARPYHRTKTIYY